MMKRLLPLLLVPFWLHAEASVPVPPQGDAPFRIVIEEVAEEASPDAEKAADAADVAPDTPVVEDEEEVPVADAVPNCGHVTTPPKAYDLEVLMLQIFLDRHNFPGGVIDGVWGGASRDAMRAWQRSEGLRPTQWVDVALYGRIAEVENILAHAVIIDETEDSEGKISLGCTIKVEDMETGDEELYAIVGSQEANPMECRISDDSPFGKALLGHKVGDIVEVEAPIGVLKYKILTVEK